MKNLKHVLSVTLAVLAVLILTGCDNKDNPVRTSLDVDTSTMTLTVGESATRTATTKASPRVKPLSPSTWMRQRRAGMPPRHSLTVSW